MRASLSPFISSCLPHFLSANLNLSTCERVLQPLGRAKTPPAAQHSKDILIHHRCVTKDLSSSYPSGYIRKGTVPYYWYILCSMQCVHDALWLNKSPNMFAKMCIIWHIAYCIPVVKLRVGQSLST